MDNIKYQKYTFGSCFFSAVSDLVLVVLLEGVFVVLLEAVLVVLLDGVLVVFLEGVLVLLFSGLLETLVGVFAAALCLFSCLGSISNSWSESELSMFSIALSP